MVCVRADSPEEVDKGEEVVQDVFGSAPVSLPYNLDLSDVDIYTKYATGSSPVSTDSSDAEDNQELK